MWSTKAFAVRRGGAAGSRITSNPGASDGVEKGSVRGWGSQDPGAMARLWVGRGASCLPVPANVAEVSRVWSGRVVPVLIRHAGGRTRAEKL